MNPSVQCNDIQGITKSLYAYVSALDSTDKKKVRVQLDSGSNRSLIKRNIPKCLDVIGDPTDLTVKLATGVCTTTTREEKMFIKLMNVQCSFQTTIQVITCKKIGMLPAVRFNPNEYDHLKDIKFTHQFPVNHDMPIDLLIGEPMYSHLLCGSPILNDYTQPGAQETKLGWALCGAYPQTSQTISCYGIQHEEKTSLIKIANTMEKFWELEHLGITPPKSDDMKYTADEMDAIRVFNENAKYDSKAKKWTVPLPWKNGRPESNENGPIGDNYKKAVARMYQVERKTKKEDYEHVKHAYSELVSKGWSRKLTPEEMTNHDHAKYHLITRPVIHYERTTTPVRVIFDAGNRDARTGMSLNNLLHQGPCLLPEIPHVILRFRQNKWAFILDITKMFFVIRVPEEDQVFLRYVWRDFDTNSPPTVYQMLVYIFGLISSPFVAIYCVIKLAEMFEHEFIEAVKLLRKQLYVDDIATGCHSKDKARKMVRDLKELLSRGSFYAHKFASNAHEILADLEDKDKAKQSVVKVLGLFWDTTTDEFYLDFDSKLQDDEHVTKRSLMSQTAMLYDIMGFVQPYILVYKILLQEVWMLEADEHDVKKKSKSPRKMNYDKEITGPLRDRWIQWKKQIPLMKTIRMKRWDQCHENAEVSVAIFGDASSAAYGAVAYVLVTSNGITTSTLAMSKSRLPPKKLKPMSREKKDEVFTIVRLELLAALLAMRLGQCVAKGLDIPKNRMHLFSDSLVNLLRIQSGKGSYKSWVASRVAEINDMTDKGNWHFCPGTCNPADLVSRGTTLQELKESKVWWNGPPWLIKRNEWPCQPIIRKTELEKMAEEKERQKTDDFEIYVHAIQVQDDHVISKLNARIERFTTMTRVLAWMLRFKKPFNKRTFDIKKDELTLDEVHTAELHIIRFVQECSFPTEISCLRKGSTIPKDSKLRNLDPSLNEHGIIVHNSRLPLDEIDPHADPTPPILPKNHEITMKIILDVHVKNLHSTTELTHMLLRRKYWVIGGRNYIRKVIHTCRRKFCGPVANFCVKMGAIPSERFETLSVFANVMLDFLGPLYIQHKCEHQPCPHEGSKKCYVLLMTCFQSRALHLELAKSLKTEDFIMAFRRFVGRRGVPRKMYSDNATTFGHANRELKIALQHLDKIKARHELATSYGCEWFFSKAKSPWENGMAERLNATIKSTLRKVVGSCRMSYDELFTVITEIEQQINNRPLSAVNDANSMLPITPAEIVAGRPLTTLPDPQMSKEVNEKLDFPALWHRRRSMLNKFWQRWTNDYMIMLSPLKKWKKSSDAMLHVGDMVLVRDHDAPRNTWKIARVIELFNNERGEATSAKVKTPNGRPIHRSLRNLALLESEMQIKGPAAHSKEQHREVLKDDTCVANDHDGNNVNVMPSVRRSKRLLEKAHI